MATQPGVGSGEFASCHTCGHSPQSDGVYSQNESGALRTPRGRRTTRGLDSQSADCQAHVIHYRRECPSHDVVETGRARCSSRRRRRSSWHRDPNIDTVRFGMVQHTTARRLSATIARHHWGSRLRIALHLGPDEHFVLLSSADGATSIHIAIDEDGNIGGDWWGQAHGECPATALQLFAERHQLSVSDLLAVVRPLDTLTPTLPQAAPRSAIAEAIAETWPRPLLPATRADTLRIGHPNDGEHTLAATAVSRRN